jgi:hypothetical protein
MRARTTATVAAAALAAVLLAACGDDDDSSDETTTTTTSTISSTVVDATDDGATDGSADGGDDADTSSTTEPAGDDLADGEHFGYLVEFEVGDAGAAGQFDLAQLLTGQEAIDAAAADSVELDGDFYISNVNPKLRFIAVAPTAKSSVIGEGAACCEPLPTTLDDFFTDFDPPVPVILTVQDGIVTEIAEQYFP